MHNPHLFPTEPNESKEVKKQHFYFNPLKLGVIKGVNHITR